MKTPTITAKIPADAWETLVKLVPQYAAYAVPDRRRGFKKAPAVSIAPSDFLVQTTSETLTAYADSVENPTADAMRRRNLSFKSAHPVTVAEARKIFAKACPHGYNAFESKVLRAIPADRMLYLAREGSPAVYVLGPEMKEGTQDKALADEFDFYADGYTKEYGENRFTIAGPVTRVWWD